MRLFLIAVFCCGVMTALAVRVEGASCGAKCKARVVAKAKRHQRYQHDKEIASMSTALASWYYDAGATACGIHAYLGVAHKTLPCGTFVRMCKVHCVTARVQDRGPFIAGREFDLNPALKSALGCGDLCTVHYRVLHEDPLTAG
jgi:rare lipoprotein A (peptidoglycan hydrolase)